MDSIALAVICKTPIVGHCKTRLSPPLSHEECARLSACFIRDLSATIQTITRDGGVTGYAVYTPLGSEAALSALLPAGFGLVPQGVGNLGARLLKGVSDLLNIGHAGAILINSDSPTLPVSVLREAVSAVRRGDNVVLGPAYDGGYTLVGLSKPHARIFADIPWSTSDVYRLTLVRANEINLPIINVPVWYDVDDAASLRMLEDELNGKPFVLASDITGAYAPATRRFLAMRRLALMERAS